MSNRAWYKELDLPLQRDKYKRPYVKCPTCNRTLFVGADLHNPLGEKRIQKRGEETQKEELLDELDEILEVL